jgi:hypothetical protein
MHCKSYVSRDKKHWNQIWISVVQKHTKSHDLLQVEWFLLAYWDKKKNDVEEFAPF